jgi:uncharacterized membrane protein
MENLTSSFIRKKESFEKVESHAKSTHALANLKSIAIHTLTTTAIVAQVAFVIGIFMMVLMVIIAIVVLLC